MALSDHEKVPMPAGVTVRGGGRRYVYKVTRAYRNGRGRPTSDRVLIGRLDEASGMLVPNARYWELCAGEAPAAPAVRELPAAGSVRSFGASWLVSSLLEGLGVPALLEGALGEADGRAALTCACYMACRGNVMAGLADWCDQEAPGLARATSQSASALFARLGRPQRMAFLRGWVASLPRGEWLAYDVTSLSTYSEGIADAEWGHNRDGERLPQLNLAVYVGRRTRLPYAYCSYQGSVTDVSHLPHMMADNAALGIGDGATFVMDRGFCSTRNVRWMAANGVAFLAAVEVRHKSVREAVRRAAPLVGSRSSLADGSGVYGVALPGTYYGERLTMHVFYDPALAARNERDLWRSVANDEAAAAQLRSPSAAERRRYSRFLRLGVGPDGAVSCERDHESIDGARSRCGYFCLLASDPGLTSAEALAAYRERDRVEKCFDELKNHLDMDRLRTHSGETTEGKLLCAFAACVAVCEMERRLGPWMRSRSASKADVLREMGKLRCVDDGGGSRLLTPVTKTQREILAACGLTPGDAVAYASRF